MNRIMALLILAAPFAAPLAVVAADDADSSFYNKAAEAGLSEVDAGNLAQQKGTNQQVKDFAAMMVKDHTKANDKLTTLASSKNVTLPTSASMGQMATKAKLNMESGDTFDKAYIKSQVQAHKDTIALFKKESESGRDTDAKAFAKETLPTLQAHLKKVDAIAADMGLSK